MASNGNNEIKLTKRRTRRKRCENVDQAMFVYFNKKNQIGLV